MEHLISHYIAMLYGGSYSYSIYAAFSHSSSLLFAACMHAYIIYTYSKIQPIKHVQI